MRNIDLEGTRGRFLDAVPTANLTSGGKVVYVHGTPAFLAFLAFPDLKYLPPLFTFLASWPDSRHCRLTIPELWDGGRMVTVWS